MEVRLVLSSGVIRMTKIVMNLLVQEFSSWFLFVVARRNQGLRILNMLFVRIY